MTIVREDKGSYVAVAGKYVVCPPLPGSPSGKERVFAARAIKRLAREGKLEALSTGVQVAEDAPSPPGKVRTGEPRIEQRDGKPVSVWDVIDAPQVEPKVDPIEELKARLDALEGK